MATLTERLWIALLAIPAASIERAFWYAGMAGFAWVTLHLLLHRWLAGRKISNKPTTRTQLGWELLCSLRSLAVYGLVGGFMTFSVMSKWTPMYFRIEKFGWAYFFLSIALTILIHDTYFYWTHRLMHHPRLFKRMHGTHHYSTNPSPWAAYSFSTWEAFVQAGIAPLVIFTLPIHPLAFSTFMIWQIGFNVLGHCGYELYPRWFVRSPLGYLFNTTTHHAQHHETNRANFGLYFNFWDRVMGTNHAHYPDRFAETTSQAPTSTHSH
ncbi:sterol desaturase family protein [Anatilimnocola sp. NA78]|uniref:sterol desaturase family protein n=1 Tax=Anatilimnocola sp. NA78 TaxID=3415683 RepID=UPI003CE4D33A